MVQHQAFAHTGGQFELVRPPVAMNLKRFAWLQTRQDGHQPGRDPLFRGDFAGSFLLIGAGRRQIHNRPVLVPGCLARSLFQLAGPTLRDIPFQQQISLPVHYKGTRLDCGYRLDFLVADTSVIEVKAIDVLLPIHHAQLLSYLKLGGWKLGLLINFHVPLLREGIQRVVLGLEEPPKSSPLPPR